MIFVLINLGGFCQHAIGQEIRVVRDDIRLEEGQDPVTYPPGVAKKGLQRKAETRYRQSSNLRVAAVREGGTNDVLIQIVGPGVTTITFQKSLDQWKTWTTYILTVTVNPRRNNPAANRPNNPRPNNARPNNPPANRNAPGNNPGNSNPANGNGNNAGPRAGNSNNGLSPNAGNRTPAGNPGAATIDSCLVGLWKSIAITPAKDGFKMYDSGGEGVSMTISADGIEELDYSQMKPFIRTFAGETTTYFTSGAARAEFTTAGGEARITKILESTVSHKQDPAPPVVIPNVGKTAGQFALGFHPKEHGYTCTREALSFQSFPAFTANFKRIHEEEGLSGDLPQVGKNNFWLDQSERNYLADKYSLQLEQFDKDIEKAKELRDGQSKLNADAYEARRRANQYRELENDAKKTAERLAASGNVDGSKESLKAAEKAAEDAKSKDDEATAKANKATLAGQAALFLENRAKDAKARLDQLYKDRDR